MDDVIISFSSGCIKERGDDGVHNEEEERNDVMWRGERDGWKVVEDVEGEEEGVMEVGLEKGETGEKLKDKDVEGERVWKR